MIFIVLNFALIFLEVTLKKKDKDRFDKIVRKAGGKIKHRQPRYIVPTTSEKQNIRNHKRSQASSA